MLSGAHRNLCRCRESQKGKKPEGSRKVLRSRWNSSWVCARRKGEGLGAAGPAGPSIEVPRALLGEEAADMVCTGVSIGHAAREEGKEMGPPPLAALSKQNCASPGKSNYETRFKLGCWATPERWSFRRDGGKWTRALSCHETLCNPNPQTPHFRAQRVRAHLSRGGHLNRRHAETVPQVRTA